MNTVSVVKNSHKGVEITLDNTHEVFDLATAIRQVRDAKSIWILQDGYFRPEVYEFLTHMGYELYIRNGQSRARITISSAELPPFPSFIIGAGGVLYDDKNREILMIKEKNRPVKTFKFPGGYVNWSENPLHGAMREVHEEVGIKSSPILQHPICTVYSKKETSNGMLLTPHGDLYCVYLLKPYGKRITIDENEIECAQWISIDEYYGWTNVSSIQEKIRTELMKIIPPQ